MTNFAGKSLIDMAASFIEDAGEQKPAEDYDPRRPLSDGSLKHERTGYVDYPPWVDLNDYPDDLGSNR